MDDCIDKKITGHKLPLLDDVDFDLDAIIDEQSIISHFQPIFSIKNTKVIGVEALARAVNPINNNTIPPTILFEEANKRKLTLKLDRICRRKAIESFSKLADVDPDLLLFMNLDSSVLNKHIVGSNNIINLVNEFSISPERIVIEFVESRVHDEHSLQHFITTHREHGFLIAIDDMGCGYSNLERIPLMKPDIIKLDRSLVSGINQEYHKQELFEFFIKLAHKIGVLVIAEGIETLDEALSCLERDADLVQGFYFAKPQIPDPLLLSYSMQKSIDTAIVFKEFIKTKFENRKLLYNHYYHIADEICNATKDKIPEHYDYTLINIMNQFTEVECSYILFENGIQASSTVLNPNRKHRNRSTLFAPANAGTDQSSKDYFLFLSENQKRYVTDPYISKASGNVCITIATLVKLSTTKIVVCIDIDTQCQ